MVICYTILEIWRVVDVIFIFDFGLLFAVLHPLPNQSFKNVKKTSGDIINLHMGTKSYDHMMYSSSDIVRDGRTDT